MLYLVEIVFKFYNIYTYIILKNYDFHKTSYTKKKNNNIFF